MSGVYQTKGDGNAIPFLLFTAYPVFALIFDLITKTRIPLFRRKDGTIFSLIL